MKLALITACLLATGGAVAVAGPAYADEVEQVVNGGFDGTADPWFGTTPIILDAGRACLDVPGGTTNRWDVIIGQNDIDLVAGESYRFEFFAAGNPDAHVARAVVGLAVAPYDTYFEASPVLSVSGNSYSYTFTASTSTAQGQVAMQVGGSPDPWRFCLDDVSLVGGVPPEVYEPDTGPRVRVNQVAYLPDGPKNATLVTAATERLPWELRNRNGKPVAGGWTSPRGVDVTSGQNVHSIDFGAYRHLGKGLTLAADGEASRPFDIGASAYERLRTDALKMFYTQRSGIEIDDALRPGYGRPAGHVDVAPNLGDGDVPCQPGVCDYRLDVTGGWYDAGDHGKYVVNGGISVWQMLNQYERSRLAGDAQPGKLGDGTLAIPESGNRVPDILDEARWELEFLLKMQVPAGSRSPAWPTTRSTTRTGPVCRCCRTSIRSNVSCTRCPPPRPSTWPPPRPRRPGSTTGTTATSRGARWPPRAPPTPPRRPIRSGTRPTPTASAAARTATARWTTSSTGPPPSCT